MWVNPKAFNMSIPTSPQRGADFMAKIRQLPQMTGKWSVPYKRKQDFGLFGHSVRWSRWRTWRANVVNYLWSLFSLWWPSTTDNRAQWGKKNLMNVYILTDSRVRTAAFRGQQLIQVTSVRSRRFQDGNKQDYKEISLCLCKSKGIGSHCVIDSGNIH